MLDHILRIVVQRNGHVNEFFVMLDMAVVILPLFIFYSYTSNKE